MVWKCDLSGGAPVLQVRSPEFKPQTHQKKKKRACIQAIQEVEIRRIMGQSQPQANS
jgi:hypothetical protein